MVYRWKPVDAGSSCPGRCPGRCRAAPSGRCPAPGHPVLTVAGERHVPRVSARPAPICAASCRAVAPRCPAGPGAAARWPLDRPGGRAPCPGRTTAARRLRRPRGTRRTGVRRPAPLRGEYLHQVLAALDGGVQAGYDLLRSGSGSTKTRPRRMVTPRAQVPRAACATRGTSAANRPVTRSGLRPPIVLDGLATDIVARHRTPEHPPRGRPARCWRPARCSLWRTARCGVRLAA